MNTLLLKLFGQGWGLSLWSNGNLGKQEQSYWVFFHVLPFIGLWINHPHSVCIPVTSKRKYHWGWAILWVQDAYKDAHSAVIQGFTWLAFKEGFHLLCLIVIELYCNQLHCISKLMMQEMSSLDNKIDSKQDQWWEVPSVWKKCICRLVVVFQWLIGFQLYMIKEPLLTDFPKTFCGLESKLWMQVVLKRFLQHSSCLDIAAHCIHKFYHWFMLFSLHQYKQNFICHNWGHSLIII